MCLKRVNWRQYTLSVLLLIIILASNSSQQKLFSSPRPFQQRYSKAEGVGQDGFMPIVPPTEYKPPAKPIETTEYKTTVKQNEYKTTVAPVATTEATKYDAPSTKWEPTIPKLESIKSESMAIAEAERRINTDEAEKTNEREAMRSINDSIQELQEMTMDFLAIIKQNGIQKRSVDQQRNFITDYLFNDQVINRVKKFTEKYIFQAASGSALQNIVPAGGRLFFFKGNCCNKNQIDCRNEWKKIIKFKFVFLSPAFYRL